MAYGGSCVVCGDPADCLTKDRERICGHCLCERVAEERDRAQASVLSLVRQLALSGRQRADEPAVRDLMPCIRCYADEEISDGKLKELIVLWLRGASGEELLSLLPPIEG